MKTTLFASAVVLAALQIALGLTGVGLGLVVGQCSETIKLDSGESSEQCSADPGFAALAVAVAGGGAIALAGLRVARQRPLLASAAVLAGAMFGFPMVILIPLVVIPFFLAVAGILAIHLAAEGRGRTPTGIAP
jgi:hypothetical protein